MEAKTKTSANTDVRFIGDTRLTFMYSSWIDPTLGHDDTSISRLILRGLSVGDDIPAVARHTHGISRAKMGKQEMQGHKA